MDEPDTNALITKIKSKFENLPEKPRNSKRALVNQLLPTIRLARERGYSYDEIAALLAEDGVQISAKTLKTYVGALGSKKAKAQLHNTNGIVAPLGLPRTK